MSKIASCNKGEDYNVWVCQSMESLNQWGTSKTKKGMKSPLESLFLIGMRILKKLFSARIIEITHSQYFSLQVSQTCQMFLIGCLHLRSHSLCADKVHYFLHYRLDAFLHLVQHVRLEAVIVICDGYPFHNATEGLRYYCHFLDVVFWSAELFSKRFPAFHYNIKGDIYRIAYIWSSFYKSWFPESLILCYF